MAIVEVQFQQSVFFNLVKAQVIRTALPGDFIDSLGPFLIERLECNDIAIVDDAVVVAAAKPKPDANGVVGPTPNTGFTAPGQLLLQASLTVQVTSYVAAKAAGHLKPPATSPVPAKLFIRLGASAADGLTYNVLGVVFNDVWKNVTMAPGKQPFTSPGSQLQFAKAAVVAQAGVLAIRLGTHDSDNLLAVDPLTFNRLGANQWGQFVAGQAFAELVGSALNEALDAVIVESTDPKLEMIDRATGAWFLPQRLAGASANINAVDAQPADFDETIRVEAAATINPYPVGGVDILYGFDLDVRVQWIADDLLTDLGFGFIQDKVNEKVGEHLSDPPDGYQEIERADDHIRYRAPNYMKAPHGDAFTCHVADVHVDDSGLVVLGSVTIPAPPAAVFSAELPEWGFSGDCHNKTVRQVLKPAHVQVVGTDPRLTVYLRAEPKVEPAGSWTSERRMSLPGASPVTLDVYFTRRNVPPTGGALVYVYTNVGVRCINLGVLPAKPPVSEHELLARTMELISECMAISDRWGEGVLNLRWLVDPPPDAIDHGIPPVIEWAIAIDEVQEVDAVELVAVNDNGARRELGRVPVSDGHVVAQVITAADETLEIRTSAAMAGPAPRVSGRWVVPWSVTEIGDDVQALAIDNGVIAVLRADGRAELVDPTSSGARQPAGMAVANELARRNTRGLAASVRTQSLGASTVAAYDRGWLVLGVAGAFVPVGQAREV